MISETSIPHVDGIDWTIWEPKEKAVLCFVLDKEKIMLIHKKTGLGAGKINGPGGRIEPGETPAEAAVRETREETGITPDRLNQRGDLSFIFTNGYSLHGSVFLASSWTGELTETEEASPFWCPLSQIPYKNMWEDDPLWLPHVLAGKYISGKFIFDDDLMLSQRITFGYPKL